MLQKNEFSKDVSKEMIMKMQDDNVTETQNIFDDCPLSKEEK